MRFTEEHEQFRKSVRAVIESEPNPYVDEREAAGIFPAHELFPKLAKVGVFGLEYDPEYGGQGADHTYTVVLGEELGATAHCAVYRWRLRCRPPCRRPRSLGTAAMS